MINLNIGEDESGKRLYIEGRAVWGTVVSENLSEKREINVISFYMGGVDLTTDIRIMATTSRQFLNTISEKSGIPEVLLKELFLKLFMEEQSEGIFKNIHKL